MKTIGFIGTGNMGSALAKAAARGGNNLLLANRHPEKAERLAAEIGGKVCGNIDVANVADFIFLGVKPNMLNNLVPELSAVLNKRSSDFCLVTMLAGRTISSVLEAFSISCPVIRIMPNTPAAIGEGTILYTCSPSVSKETEASFLEAMSHAGRFIKLDEMLIDAGSAVSGCGPAFVALFIEALADGGVACGLPRKQALELAAGTVAGMAKLVTETGSHPGALKDAVCSPGGTTIQGVRALEEHGFRGAVMDAVIAAYEKTLAL